MRRASSRQGRNSLIYPRRLMTVGAVLRERERAVRLDEVHHMFRRWLGEMYDIDVLDAVLATALGRWTKGDPAWLLIVAGSGDAKTETLEPLAAVGAVVVSTRTSLASTRCTTAEDTSTSARATTFSGG